MLDRDQAAAKPKPLPKKGAKRKAPSAEAEVESEVDAAWARAWRQRGKRQVQLSPAQQAVRAAVMQAVGATGEQAARVAELRGCSQVRRRSGA